MVNLPTNITSVIVVISVGFYLAVIGYLVVIPIIDAVLSRSRPQHLDLRTACENAGIALAILGFSTGSTMVAAIGVGMTLLGAVLCFGRSPDLHPVLQVPVAILGILCVGTLGEYLFLVA